VSKKWTSHAEHLCAFPVWCDRRPFGSSSNWTVLSGWIYYCKTESICPGNKMDPSCRHCIFIVRSTLSRGEEKLFIELVVWNVGRKHCYPARLSRATLLYRICLWSHGRDLRWHVVVRPFRVFCCLIFHTVTFKGFSFCVCRDFYYNFIY